MLLHRPWLVESISLTKNPNQKMNSSATSGSNMKGSQKADRNVFMNNNPVLITDPRLKRGAL